MANKRMFTIQIVDSDAFLDMPLSSQALYFHLNMRADDDGFIGNPKKIQRTVGASDDDLRLLIAKRFVLLFDDGVIVIKHWRMHNTLSTNRYKETVYTDNKDQLFIKRNSAYSLSNGDVINDANLIEKSSRQTIDAQKTCNRRAIDVQKTDTDIGLGLGLGLDIDLGLEKGLEKDLDLEKDKKKNKKEKPIGSLVYFPNDEMLDAAFKDFIAMRKQIKKPMTSRAIDLTISKLNNMTSDSDEAIAILNQSICNSWTGIFELKQQAQKTKEIDWSKV